MTAAYRRFLPHIDNNYDFAELLSEWLGELNVSHTGGRFYPKGQSEPTASLGLFFDWNYTGRGMLIAEVVEKGPFDTANTRVKAGTVIEKIDGVEITPRCGLLHAAQQQGTEENTCFSLRPADQGALGRGHYPHYERCVQRFTLQPLGETARGRR